MTLNQLIEEAGSNEIRFRINELDYVISDNPPIKGDTVIDIRNLSYGVHDGIAGKYICVRDSFVVEGCEPKFIKKLILKTIA